MHKKYLLIGALVFLCGTVARANKEEDQLIQKIDNFLKTPAISKSGTALPEILELSKKLSPVLSKRPAFDSAFSNMVSSCTGDIRTMECLKYIKSFRSILRKSDEPPKKAPPKSTIEPAAQSGE